MNRRTAHASPPCLPCGLDPDPLRSAKVFRDGIMKQSLEIGRTRLLVTGLVFALAFLIIGARIIEVSLPGAEGETRFAQRAGGAVARVTRGDIVDRNGIVLATSLPTASLYANPREIRDPRRAAALLNSVLPQLSQSEAEAKLDSDRRFVWIKRNLTPREQHRINRLGLPGLYFRAEDKRVYPHGQLAAHVVGFTDIDNKGLAGIERAFDEVLQGARRPLALSLDVRVQHILTQELAAAMDTFRAIGGAGLVLDAVTGEVLAMVSLPTFDPDHPARAPAEMRFNRASLGIYEMGSVFKIFTTAMALDQGSVTLRDGYDVSDPIRVSRFTIRDFKPRNRWLSVPEIFIHSSNIGTVHIAMEAGTKSQKRFLKKIGLIRPASIELPEVGTPLVPAPWREINTMTISYGHGLAVSPLQVANAVATVVNGGEKRPTTLLKRAEGERVLGQRVISEETSRTMRWLMRQVVQQGTGRKANTPGYLVGGKTGTADKLVGRRYARDARIASFVAAFPMNQPRYVVFVMVDEPKGNESTYGYATGGWVAAPVVQRVVERAAPLLGLRPASIEEESHLEAGLMPAAAKGLVFASK